jgi:hypothetical protein
VWTLETQVRRAKGRAGRRGAGGLEEAGPGDDLRPQPMQPVIYTNEAGERQIEMMR